MNKQFISILIPCRNEELYIKGLLESIIKNDYPKENIEVIIIDGLSNDSTAAIVRDYSLTYDFIKLYENINKTVPYAMNIGIKAAKGSLIIRMDAHAVYPENYISELVKFSELLKADNVGGIWETLPGNETLEAKAIAIALSHPFGVGNAKYRLKSSTPDSMPVDTVPFGCYPKKVFDEVGLYDEELIRNQDNELNARIIKNGGHIYLIPSIKIKYFARESLQKLGKMFFQYGYFGPLVDIKTKTPPKIRRVISSIFLLSLVIPLVLSVFYWPIIYLALASLLIYTITNITISTQLALTNKNLKLTTHLINAFSISHFSYGAGYIKGYIDFKLLKKTNSHPISLSR